MRVRLVGEKWLEEVKKSLNFATGDQVQKPILQFIFIFFQDAIVLVIFIFFLEFWFFFEVFLSDFPSIQNLVTYEFDPRFGFSSS